MTDLMAAFGRSAFGYGLFLPARLESLYHLSQDLMAFLVLVVTTIAVLRRWSGKVARLMPRSLDAEIILYLILAGGEPFIRQDLLEIAGREVLAAGQFATFSDASPPINSPSGEIARASALVASVIKVQPPGSSRHRKASVRPAAVSTDPTTCAPDESTATAQACV